MITIRKASQSDVQTLSKRLFHLLADKDGRIYQESVEKFGIPEEYVREAFDEETLVKAAAAGKATFYLAFEDDEIIGFAQTIQLDFKTAELDCIVIFPTHEGKGIGTRLLVQAVVDLKKKGTKVVIVNAGRNETYARRFYEKNGFKLVKEVTIDTLWGKKIDLATFQLQLSTRAKRKQKRKTKPG